MNSNENIKTIDGVKPNLILKNITVIYYPFVSRPIKIIVVFSSIDKNKGTMVIVGDNLDVLFFLLVLLRFFLMKYINLKKFRFI